MRSLTRQGLFAIMALVWGGSVLQAVDVAWADRMRAPKEEGHRHREICTAASSTPLQGAMRFFRTTISPIDGDRCPMYPTCSHYGEMAFRRHGTFVGLLLVVDRLFHEWSETATAPTIQVHGIQRFWDPLSHNDFWFTSKRDPPPVGAPRPGEP